MAADPHHIDPTAYLEELLTQASPDLMRQMRECLMESIRFFVCGGLVYK